MSDRQRDAETRRRASRQGPQRDTTRDPAEVQAAAETLRSERFKPTRFSCGHNGPQNGGVCSQCPATGTGAGIPVYTK